MRDKKKALLSAAGCSIAIFWSGFLAFGYPGIMSTYWQEEFNVGAAQTGSVVTFMLFAMAASMFFCGRIHVKIGMRKCIITGTACIVLAMVMQFLIQNMTGAYIWGFITNVGLSFIYGPGLATVQQWWPERRGAASALFNFVCGGSAAVMSPVWNNILESSGYTKTNTMLLICVIITNIIAALMVSEPPKADTTARRGRDYTVREALGTKAFWIMWFIIMFVGAAGISMVPLSKNYAIAIGLSSVAVLTAFNVVNGVGRILAGVMYELMGGEKTGIIIFTITGVAFLVLPHTESMAVIMIIAACAGMGFGTLFTIVSPMTSSIFGLKNFSMIFGLIFTAYGFISSLAGPTLSGYILDVTGGNYEIVFTYLAAFALTGAVLMFVLKNNCDKMN